MVAGVVLAAAALALLPAVTLAARTERPADELTKYVASLREATRLAQDARAAAAASGKDCARFGPAAAKLVEAATAAQTVFTAYARAKTRYGTAEEIRLFGMLAGDLVGGSRALTAAAGGTAPPSAREQRDAERQVGIFWTYLSQRVEDRLEVAGLAEVLTSKSFREVKAKVVAEVKTRLRDRAESELRRLVGLRITIGVPLKEQIHDFLQAELGRALSRLALAAGPAGILVTFFGGKIVSLLGAKLKEALRHKAHLQERTDATVAGFQRLQSALRSLPADAPLDRVRNAARDAEKALAATSFLRGDLARAGKTELIARLDAAEKSLRATVFTARYRFLLDSPLLDEDFTTDARYAARIAADARTQAKRLGCALPAAGGTTPPGKGAAPTKATCVSSFTMESIRSVPPYDVTGTFGVGLARFERINAHHYRCLWTAGNGSEAFIALIDVVPPGSPGELASGNCDGTRSPGSVLYSRKRHLSVGGGTRLSSARAAGGDAKILAQVLAQAEAQGVGAAC